MPVTTVTPQVFNTAPPAINTPLPPIPLAESIVPPLPTAATAGIPEDPKELRVRISMPPDSPKIFYKDEFNLIMKPLVKTFGFIFPVQPSITMTHSAEYQSTKPTHTNFPYYHYTNSEISQISLTGEFPIRTANDAKYVHAGIHFLRSCTRMFNSADGIYSGAPPMVLRLNGLGMSGYDNIPVVLTSVVVNYIDSVDYVTFTPFITTPELAKLPVVVSIQITMNPVFSREFITNKYSTLGFSKGEVRLLGNAPKLNKDPVIPKVMNVTPPDIQVPSTSIQDIKTPVGFSSLPGAVPTETVPGVGNLSNLPPPPSQQVGVAASGPKIPGSPGGFGGSFVNR